MPGYSPPSIPRSWLAGIGLVFALLFGYSLLVVQTPLLVLFPAVLAGLLYVGWRFLVAIEAIADAQQRLARHREEN
ncbi:hypothetical protein [Halorientalis salina]|uniref:hypothetical protein n=1 Tax=Halorientalis salina TaxID=2932266 RepID=UPI0010AB7B19|nr:hypothetical protein [Halorientalis salina]